MMEALRVMTYFKVSLSTCNWDSALPNGGESLSSGLTFDPRFYCPSWTIPEVALRLFPSKPICTCSTNASEAIVSVTTATP